MSALLPIYGLSPSRDTFFDRFEQQFNSIVNKFFNDGPEKVLVAGNFPKIDIIIDDGKWILEASVPGHKSEDIEIEVIPPEEKVGVARLKISGRVNSEHRYSDTAHFQHREIKRSGWQQVITLPEFVKDEPEASLKDGILRLVWKVDGLAKPKPKLIAIK